MIVAVYNDGTFKTVYGLWQWDYGQILRIQGLNLPDFVEVHFALQEKRWNICKPHRNYERWCYRCDYTRFYAGK